MSETRRKSAEALVASGRVDARIVYLDPNNTLSYNKSLASQSLGGDLSPPFPPQGSGSESCWQIGGTRRPP